MQRSFHSLFLVLFALSALALASSHPRGLNRHIYRRTSLRKRGPITKARRCVARNLPSQVPASQAQPAPTTTTPATSSTQESSIVFEEAVPTTLQAPPVAAPPVAAPPATTQAPAVPAVQAPQPTTSSPPAPQTTPARQVTAPTTGGSSGDISEYLKWHNTVRSQHNAADLTWSDTLAAAAQQWANKCVFEHSGGVLGRFGENLAAGTSDTYSIQQAITSWTNEVSDYNPSSPAASHYTQVVWRSTTQVGCALAQGCQGIFPGSSARYYVCEYSPAGNVIGQFADNVQ